MVSQKKIILTFIVGYVFNSSLYSMDVVLSVLPVAQAAFSSTSEIHKNFGKEFYGKEIETLSEIIKGKDSKQLTIHLKTKPDITKEIYFERFKAEIETQIKSARMRTLMHLIHNIEEQKKMKSNIFGMFKGFSIATISSLFFIGGVKACCKETIAVPEFFCASTLGIIGMLYAGRAIYTNSSYGNNEREKNIEKQKELVKILSKYTNESQ